MQQIEEKDDYRLMTNSKKSISEASDGRELVFKKTIGKNLSVFICVNY